jgi:hypothetical protein
MRVLVFSSWTTSRCRLFAISAVLLPSGYFLHVFPLFPCMWGRIKGVTISVEIAPPAAKNDNTMIIDSADIAFTKAGKQKTQ